MRHPLGLALFVVVSLIVLPALLGHQEDPKSRYRQAPFMGGGYQSGPAGGGGGGSAPAFPAQGVTLLSWLTLPELGTGIANGNDCWGYTTPSGREYALMAHSEGITVVEITVPGAPQVIGSIGGPSSLWRDVKTYSTFAYVVSEGGGGIQIVDLSDVDNGNVTLVNTVTTGGTTATHNVAIDTDSGFLYRCGGGGNGLRIYSLAVPSNPVFVGSWNNRYVHDVQVVTYTSGPYAGQQVAFACSGLNGGSVDTGLDILNVTNKGNITTFSQTIYPNGQYSHQAWLSEDRQYLYLDDELDEGNLGTTTLTFIFNVANLSQPILQTSFTNGNTAIGHNLYVVGDLIYEANYRSGMRVFDASNPLAPVEIAYFDTYPADDATAFNGLWSVYPYFDSGVVIGSDLERGLFVWQIGDPSLTYSYPGGVPTSLDPEGDSVFLEIVPQSGLTLDTNSPTLWYDIGSGFTPQPLIPLGGSLFEAVFPSTVCGTEVSWYIEANALGEPTVFDPIAAPGQTFLSTSQLGKIQISIDGMETDLGWTVGDTGDTASTGVWTRVDPIGTNAQPEDDHSAVGAICWVTGQGTIGGALGENDVDGGATTLITPPYDLTGAFDPVISYWRWYSNNSGGAAGEDTFQIDITSNGVDWEPVETIGPIGPGSAGGWNSNAVRVLDHVALSTTVQLRFVASDFNGGSIVEAAIDDLLIADTVCVDCNGNGIDDVMDIATGTSVDANGDGIPDECAAGCPEPFLRGDTNGDLSLDVSDVVIILSYLFSGGVAPSPIDRADIDGAGVVDLADAIQLLNYLFAGGAPPVAPWPNPGCP